MDLALYPLLTYLHVLLFVYWLGSDLGVWIVGKHITRDDLALDERLRTRKLAVIIDMAPRTCLVLMLPVGFTLAVDWGAPLSKSALVGLWVFGLIWLWLVWQVHWKKNEPMGNTLQVLDLTIRYVVGTVLFIFGGYCLATGGPVSDNWLAAKILLFGAIIYNGIVLRKVAGDWQEAFDMILLGGDQRIEGERILKANRRRVEPPVLTLWALVACIGFLGITKPF